jgi:hypothetical protein
VKCGGGDRRMAKAPALHWRGEFAQGTNYADPIAMNWCKLFDV